MFQGHQKGVASVEFAVVLPLLMLLICGTIEFGALFYNKQVLTNASREAARAGITGESSSAIQEIVSRYCEDRLIGLKNAVAAGMVGVVVSPPDAQNDLTVTVNLDYDFLFAKLVGIDQTTISAQTVMRMEPL